MESKEIYKFSFEKLIAWQKAKDLLLFIYKLSTTIPQDEKFGIISQMKRAAVSVSANIAEGNSKDTKREKARYITIAYGSLMELLNYVIILFELEYINVENLNDAKSKISEIAKIMSGLKKKYS